MTDFRDQLVLALMSTLDVDLWYQSNPETRKQLAKDAYAMAEAVMQVRGVREDPAYWTDIEMNLKARQDGGEISAEDAEAMKQVIAALWKGSSRKRIE